MSEVVLKLVSLIFQRMENEKTKNQLLKSGDRIERAV